MKSLTLANKTRLSKRISMSQNDENISIEEMYKVLEDFGVKRDTLEKIHPSSETLSHLYQSIKKQTR